MQFLENILQNDMLAHPLPQELAPLWEILDPPLVRTLVHFSVVNFLSICFRDDCIIVFDILRIECGGDCPVAFNVEALVILVAFTMCTVSQAATYTSSMGHVQIQII